MAFDPNRSAPPVFRWAPRGPGGLTELQPAWERPRTKTLSYAALLLAVALLQALPMRMSDSRLTEGPVVIGRALEPERLPPADAASIVLAPQAAGAAVVRRRPAPLAVHAVAVEAAPETAPEEAAEQSVVPLVERSRDLSFAPGAQSDTMGLLGRGLLDLRAREERDIADFNTHPHNAGPSAQIGL